MGKQFKDERERLSAFSEMQEHEMEEGTSVYHKFRVPGEKLDGIFMGMDKREFDADKQPGKMTECAIVKDVEGVQHLLAQTIVVNELKKKWDELKEVGFPVRIIFTGMAKENTPEQYQNFRMLYEPAAAKSESVKPKK